MWTLAREQRYNEPPPQACAVHNACFFGNLLIQSSPLLHDLLTLANNSQHELELNCGKLCQMFSPLFTTCVSTANSLKQRPFSLSQHGNTGPSGQRNNGNEKKLP